MKGVLLINLGSPDSPNKKDVKRYLDEFLMDERVIDTPKWWRTILVKGIILNTRPKKSAEAYKKVWTKEGSPLIVYSNKLLDKVQNNVDIPVELAMRYGNPSIKTGIQNLVNKGVSELFIISLYPQFAMATTETVEEKVKEVQSKYFPSVKLSFLDSFYADKDYINVLTNSIKEHLKDKDFDKLLFSYHGIPERHIYKSDTTKSHCKIDGSCCSTNSIAHKKCYRHQCFKTTELVVEKLNLPANKFENSFQSRLGRDPWLQPYTAEKFETLPQNGIKKLAVVTPAFVADCLETIEEIGMEGKEDFIHHGGKEFTTIPCLNDRDDWALLLAKWINNWVG